MPEAACDARRFDLVPAYADELAAGAADKAAPFARWIAADATGTVMDIGCGPDAVAACLAAARPGLRVLGIDAHPGMVAVGRCAPWRRGQPGFPVGACRPAARRRGYGLSTVSSVLHELAAQGGLVAVDRALRCAAASLVHGGRLIVREFVRPASATTAVVLRHAQHEVRQGRSFTDFVRAAAFAVRCEGSCIAPDAVRYGTDVEGANEYALRKDCGDAWEAELTQRYTFWSQAECCRLLQDAGLRIVHLRVAKDPRIVTHRRDGRLSLCDAATGAPLPVPAAKLVAVAERL